MRKPPPRYSLSAIAAGLCLVLLIAGCSVPKHHRVIIGHPPVIPGQAAGPDLNGMKQPSLILPFVTGTVSRPIRRLTPGAVRHTTRAGVCSHPLPSVRIRSSVRTAVLSAYGYIRGALQGHYVLDYLIPMRLGGRPVAANVWPAATSGIGLTQKVQLDRVLYHRVCSHLMTLPQAQAALKTDWFAAWLKYVVEES
jgi:hypothetical protein